MMVQANADAVDLDEDDEEEKAGAAKARGVPWIASSEPERPVASVGTVGRAHRHLQVRGTGERFIAWWPPGLGAGAGAPLPLVLYLHGASCRGDDPLQILARGEGTPPRLLDDGDLCLEAVVVSPLLKARAEWAKTLAQAASVLRVLEAVVRVGDDERHEMPRVDRGRVYCTGTSCGGLGAYTLAARLAARSVCPGANRPIDSFFPPFAAAVPVCGGGSPVFAKLLAATPTWFWHGQDDVVVDVADTDAIVDQLRALEAPVRYTRLSETPELPAYCSWMTGHNAWTPAFRQDSPLWPWLFAQSLASTSPHLPRSALRSPDQATQARA